MNWLAIKYKNEQPWVKLRINFSELRKISGKENLYFKPIIPKLSDLELISLIILTEFKSIDSEYQLFREIKCFGIESKI